jgi:putative endonuclease
MTKSFFVYIMASGHYGTLYTGVTSNLPKRIWEHKNNAVEGFTQKYAVHTLVYYEPHDSAESAITREKQIKAWKRDWKTNLIEHDNPHWEDLGRNMEPQL